MKRGTTFWMHIIDGRPAGFDGDQVCYWWTRAPLATSLAQIRREQRASINYRYRNRFPEDPDRYGHITVRVP